MKNKKKRKERAIKKMKRVSKRIVETDIKKELIPESEIKELLSPRRAIDLKIMQSLEGLPKTHFTTLLLVEPTSYSKINIELIRIFCKEHVQGIYVTLNRSFLFLNELFQSEGINIDNMKFIDAITKVTGRKEVKAENLVYVESPNNLVELSVEIDEAIKSVKEKPAFLIFDSISTLLIYNEIGSCEKFIHLVIGKLQESKLKGIFLMVKSDEMKGIINTLSQFCDKTIEISF
ncbi:MAG: hypothetical protein ABIE23_06255 [archaeon]|nr:hypothetical protein [Candidatus Micrarchaeota archaeon]